jgi:hypothetical protein
MPGILLSLMRLCLLVALIDASCDTFRNACPVQLGEAVNSGNTLLLANRGAVYLTFTPTSSTPSVVQLMASVLYGRVEFYATMGDASKEPSTSRYDLSSALSGSPDLLSIVSPFRRSSLAFMVTIDLILPLPFPPSLADQSCVKNIANQHSSLSSR